MKTFASIFTGGGLADVGAKQSGYELGWGIELEPEIAEIAQHNLGHQVHVASAIGFDWRRVDRVDHLHLSPPCQDFSVAKRIGRKSNANGEIARACIEAITALQPQSLTLENVEGYRRAPEFGAIVDSLWGLGYWVQADVLNAADFGVPQTRRRLILRATRGGFPRPLSAPVPWRGWYEAIEDLLLGLPECDFAPWQKERLPAALKKSGLIDFTQSQRTATIRAAPEPAMTICAVNRPGPRIKAFLVDDQSNGNPGPDGQRGLTIRVGKQPSFTVSASQSHRSIRAGLPEGQVVGLTPRAVSRLQSLPDWYELPDKAALAYQIIGNGVPCEWMKRLLTEGEI